MRAGHNLGCDDHFEYGQLLALGPRSSFPPPVDAERRAIIEQLPAPAAVDALCSWGVRYVVLNVRHITEDERARWIDIMNAVPVARERPGVDTIHKLYVLDRCP